MVTTGLSALADTKFTHIRSSFQRSYSLLSEVLALPAPYKAFDPNRFNFTLVNFFQLFMMIDWRFSLSLTASSTSWDLHNHIGRRWDSKACLLRTRPFLEIPFGKFGVFFVILRSLQHWSWPSVCLFVLVASSTRATAQLPSLALTP